MNQTQMNRLIRHLDVYFQQNDSLVIHPVQGDPHIDILLYPPNEVYPFWKLVTMGASDHKMSPLPVSLGNRNEYILFVESCEDLYDRAVCHWYCRVLWEISLYSVSTGVPVTYGHSIQWPVDEGEEMAGAFLTMPQIFPDTGILRCDLGLFRKTVCLQAVLLTASEIETLLKIGPQAFDDYLYPENGPCHYFSQRRRTDSF